MSNNSNASSSGGIGFFGLLFIVLFVLKIVGYLDDISWWWITAPLWGPIVFVFVVAAITFIIFLICCGVTFLLGKK